MLIRSKEFHRAPKFSTTIKKMKQRHNFLMDSAIVRVESRGYSKHTDVTLLHLYPPWWKFAVMCGEHRQIVGNESNDPARANPFVRMRGHEKR